MENQSALSTLTGGTIAPPIVPLLTAAIGGISNMENQSALSPLTGIGRNNNNGNNNNNYY